MLLAAEAGDVERGACIAREVDFDLHMCRGLDAFTPLHHGG